MNSNCLRSVHYYAILNPVLIKLLISQVIETVHMEDDVFSCMPVLPSSTSNVPCVGSSPKAQWTFILTQTILK